MERVPWVGWTEMLSYRGDHNTTAEAVCVSLPEPDEFPSVAGWSAWSTVYYRCCSAASIDALHVLQQLLLAALHRPLTASRRYQSSTRRVTAHSRLQTDWPSDLPLGATQSASADKNTGEQRRVCVTSAVSSA